ncbi:MAG TPA: response regulator, partial [Desulfurivibrionaceae bacterium]|nr:response regulator [Desulfurivibrionaceae bacterium]
VMNLVINASEAIGEKSGIITITTGAQECTRDYLSSSYLDEAQPEGLYSYVEVADTGCGMSQEVLAKLFDPFFTTKFTGRGLGMAAVLGIVRGHKGCIKVYSEAGQGTTIKILFPISTKDRESLAPEKADVATQRHATILLADDDETVRAVGKDMLTRLGHTVFTAVDGRDCLDIYAKERDTIDCIILDLTMPRLTGEEAFRELRRLNPAVRVIISSGYNEEEIHHRFAGKGLAGFIQKPYTLATLTGVLAKALNHPRDNGG